MGQIQLQNNICAIFVHAGAGFHSRENEAKHLEVCALAAEAGMTFLRHGGSAVDAVEMAVMVLEDAPITNAGYGSNLTDKGQVECDASIVDHFGRSGAAGAVPNVKNPIQLARKIYDHSYNAMPMSRVPPNFLVGEGATDFAWDHKIMVLPNECLIATLSHQRYQNWCHEVADYKRDNPLTESEAEDLWRRGTPSPNSTRLERAYPGFQKILDAASSIEYDQDTSQSGSLLLTEALDGETKKGKARASSTSLTIEHESTLNESANHDRKDGEDLITDTVGAIAVDMYGNIAAGASSGGIGMKHRGRVGPAALIGVGNHVIPVNPNDVEKTTVAVVTSGTGEHIASTFAARTCADKLYHNHSLNDAGSYVTVNEEEAIRDMIVKDFAGHPAVLNSEIPGSIGILAVKKTVDGIALFFGHNTDSFALAYMSNKDTTPGCVMSRNEGQSPCAQGGVMIRPKK
ncbi:Peptidase T2 asparaginase 2 [Penicillium taxi]|uniref:Peptidase T2 asparaginase 2 n=1 Tax=Penicillium taxi TaxID=168475 RepID=UPI00254546B1|nr:Peptidase T2 asparaginase 2 [Penicillium taxi]KAJ5893576.1 Peptidase T2 asparaginase 2 [Penicillium taxi]